MRASSPRLWRLGSGAKTFQFWFRRKTSITGSVASDAVERSLDAGRLTTTIAASTTTRKTLRSACPRGDPSKRSTTPASRRTGLSLLRQGLAALVGEAAGRPGAEPVVARPVDREDGARQGVAAGRGDEGDQPRELLLAAEPAERDRPGNALDHRTRVLGAERLGVEVPGRQRREPDVEARPLDREHLGQVLDRRASRGRVRHPRQPVV